MVKHARAAIRWMTVMILAGCILFFSSGALSQIPFAAGQDDRPAEVQAAGEEASEASAGVPAAILLEDLPAAALRATELLDSTESRLLADSTLFAIGDLIPVAAMRVDSLCAATDQLVASQATIRRFESLENDWRDLILEVDRWRKPIADRISDIGMELDRLSDLRSAWRATASRAGEERLPGDILAEIDRLVSDLDDAEDRLFKHRARLLLISYRIADLETRCRNRVDLASGEIERIRARLIVADAAPLWSQAAMSEADARLSDKVKLTLSDHVHSVEEYARANSTRIMLHLLFLIASATGIAFLGRYAAARAESDPVMARAAGILRNPVPAALLVAIVLDGALHERPPTAWALLVHLLLLVPLITLVPRLMSTRLKTAVYILAGVYLTEGVLEVLPHHSFTGRILRLAIKLTLTITVLWLLRRLNQARGQSPGTRRKLAALVLLVTMSILAASVVAGIVGNVTLGNILLEGVLNAFYLGLLVWLAVVVMRNVVTVLLRTEAVGNTNLVRNNSRSMQLGLMTALNIGGIVAWLMVALDNFNVLGPVFDGLKSALMTPHRIGSLEIAIGDILLFIFIVWLSFFISRILRAILKDEVYPRVRLAHGVPMAVSNLTHYAVLLIGFFFAIGAAGIDLNKFTLLAGALGVGIGFGLQNIVSNLVSGIIVLFERPVQTGDKVKIGTNEGEIKRIGLRATVIRTWDGAEVIIPNSRLVLDEVTNWTLSDQSRRIDINVGVAYGSDTERVTELLLKVAREHDEVLKYPEPTVLFTSFGDSSLNFSLRAWAGRFQDFLRVGSELTAEVNRALAEAGITIPFPQRDVHINPGGKNPEPDAADRNE
jgi:small-conductance mechanosensitive channel